MATVRIIEQPPVVVRVIQPAGDPVIVRAQAAAVVKVVTPGVQGPRGERGETGAALIEFAATHGGAFDVVIAANAARLLINGLMAAQSEFSVAAGSLHIPPELGVMAGDIITIQPS